jgi:hypothetical protein
MRVSLSSGFARANNSQQSRRVIYRVSRTRFNHLPFSLPNSHQNSHSTKTKMAADLAASHLLYFKVVFGSSGRTRTYNPSVNSRMLCH